MRLFLLFGCLAVLVTAVLAWTKEDHEIFDLVSALEAAEGKGTSFYSWLDVPSTASTAEISRAYRKKSIQLHPDKNPGVKGAHDRFARLGVVSKILRDAEGRKRYDFFYKNGVPRWRGTGYYYSRFRPGLGTVLVFLTFLTSVLQYIVHSLNYKRDVKRVEQIVGQARSAAWGNRLTPGEGQRKVKVNLAAPSMDEDGNAIGGRWVDMVVEGNDVFFLDSDGTLHPVDDSTATPPSWRRTWFVSLAASQWAKLFPSSTTVPTDHEEEATEDDASQSGTDNPGSGAVTPNGSSTSSGNGKARGAPAATSMAGGRRRKTVRKK